MVHRIAEAIVAFLEKHNAIAKDEREVYIYGSSIAVYTLLSTAGLLFIGLCLGAVMETVILIAIFYLNQTVGGGYHAKTHMRCFITMSVGELLYIASFSLYLPNVVNGIIGIASLIVLFAIPLVLHKNKRYLRTKKKQLTVHTYIVTTIETVVFIFIFMTRNTLFTHAFAWSFLLCAASRCAGHMLRNL